MKNSFEVIGDAAIILIEFKGATLFTIIDAADLPKATALQGTWCMWRHPRSGALYVRASGGRYYLHRLLTDAASGLVVDHIYHNTLDNRRRNLRVVTNQENILNRKGPTKDNRSSGIRGVNAVSYASGKWQARVQVCGKSHYLGLFTSKEQASRAVRQKLLEVGGIVHDDL